jgi:hexosaminidase
VIPRPAAVRVDDGVFTLDAKTTLNAPPALEGVAGWWRAATGPATGCWLPPADPASITLDLDFEIAAEGYRLSVTPESVRVTGGDRAGVFYGLQTLRQLLPPAVYRRATVRPVPQWTVPAVEITDRPRFAWRGLLLDVARHFMPKSDLLRVLDLMASHKLNVLHLHLTDDQGWRLNVPGWPRLVEIGAWRPESMVGASRHGQFDGRPHGGYYTDDDLREIVAYAADRFIRVVPEVDLPGHVGAAIAAYPQLGTTGEARPVRTAWGISPHVLAPSEEALRFCRDVLAHVCDLFPGEYVCIGGDECPTDEWVASPGATARAAQLGLAPTQLQRWFTARLSEVLAERGRRVLGWDDLLDAGAPADVTIAAWRGPEATVAAARAGHAVVACPRTSAYLDYRQSGLPEEPIPVGSLLTIEDAYAFQPVPAQLSPEEAARVIGVQACLWTEHMDSARVVDYMAFPRLCAVAEVAWTGPGHDIIDFSGRLRVHKGRLRASGVEYRRDSGPLPWQTRPDARGWLR